MLKTRKVYQVIKVKHYSLCYYCTIIYIHIHNWKYFHFYFLSLFEDRTFMRVLLKSRTFSYPTKGQGKQQITEKYD